MAVSSFFALILLGRRFNDEADLLIFRALRFEALRLDALRLDALRLDALRLDALRLDALLFDALRFFVLRLLELRFSDLFDFELSLLPLLSFFAELLRRRAQDATSLGDSILTDD